MFIDVHSQEVIGKISMARLPQLPPEKMIRLKPSRVTWLILNLLGENIRQYKVGPSSSVCWLKLFTTWPWARVLPVERLCHWNLGSLSQHHGQSSFWTLVMRNSLIDSLHFLRFTLIGTGLLPLPAANCQSWLRSVAHIFSNWHLQSWSCFPVSLHHLLVVRCGLSAAFNGKGRKVAFWDAAGCFGGGATERKPWLGSGQFFQAQRDQRSKDVLVTSGESGVTQGMKERCNVARSLNFNGPPTVCQWLPFSMRWACTKCQVLAEADLQVIGLC